MVRFPHALAVAAALAATAAAAPRAAAQDDAGGAERIVLDRVIAVVNDSVILQSELRQRVMPLLGGLENLDARDRERRRRQITDQVLQEMVNEELMVQAAVESKLQVEEKEIDAALDEIKSQNDLDDAGLKQALEMQGYTMASYRKDVKRQILRMRAVNMLVRPKVTVTDEDVRARYDEMSRRQSSVSKVRLHHVFLALPNNPTEKQVADAKARAAEVIEKHKAGVPFAQLAAEYSDDPTTKDTAGDLGWIEHGSIASEWEEIVFAMDKGEVRGPVKGPRGLHVFHVADLKSDDIEEFDEVKEQLRNEIYRREMDKQTNAWLDELRKQAHVDLKL